MRFLATFEPRKADSKLKPLPKQKGIVSTSSEWNFFAGANLIDDALAFEQEMKLKERK